MHQLPAPADGPSPDRPGGVMAAAVISYILSAFLFLAALTIFIGGANVTGGKVTGAAGRT